MFHRAGRPLLFCALLLSGVSALTRPAAAADCLQQTLDAQKAVEAAAADAAKESKNLEAKNASGAAKTAPVVAPASATPPTKKPEAAVPQAASPASSSSSSQTQPSPASPAQPVAPAAAPAGSGARQPTVDEANWADYKCRFLLDDGRIVDTANKNVSHSEGQAWGLLLAESQGDRPAFETIWRWTQKNLAVRPDALLAWRWIPGEKNAVPDRNNATDGDIMVAWALQRASQRWPDGHFEVPGAKIAADIRKRLIRVIDGKRLLVPGIQGFLSTREAKLNLSYYVFPAFASLEKLDPSPQWEDVRKDGLELLAAAQFGRWKLPPDWLVLAKGKIQLPADRPKRYSWDAIRIPLYLIWAGNSTPALLKPHLDFLLELGSLPFQPAWTNLDDDSIASYGMAAGSLAVAALVKTVSGVNKSFDRTTLPTSQDYYSSSLFMLTRLAAAESGSLPSH